ncbi:MAG: TIGR03905 family TSCPD domain-containing protein [Clostridiales bacterium]|nr:TIGR03905 family TSCPD domain-containing protein [Clostridiales bacterium]HAW16488.1 TIGR03905 family protein [Clostridiales bacterium]
MHYTFNPRGVCSVRIDFEINDDTITDVSFTGGCNGNLKAISKLVNGMKVDDIERILKGNTCGMRNTSCADQFAIAVREASDKIRS